MPRIPDDNLAYPGLLTIGDSSGTSFFLNSPDSTHLVTAHHVLFNSETSRPRAERFTVAAYPRDQTVERPQQLMFDLTGLLERGQLRSDRVHDVAVVEVARFVAGGDLDFVRGVAPVEPLRYPVIGVPRESLLSLSAVLIANDVYLFGYPVSIGLADIPQIDYGRPLLRHGIVAGKNQQRGAIIVDCAVYNGNSGGPVMQLDSEHGRNTFRVFGVAIEFVPAPTRVVHESSDMVSAAAVNSGYSVVASMDHVLRLIDGPAAGGTRPVRAST